jgi:hypothetical protein
MQTLYNTIREAMIAEANKRDNKSLHNAAFLVSFGLYAALREGTIFDFPYVDSYRVTPSNTLEGYDIRIVEEDLSDKQNERNLFLLMHDIILDQATALYNKHGFNASDTRPVFHISPEAYKAFQMCCNSSLTKFNGTIYSLKLISNSRLKGIETEIR